MSDSTKKKGDDPSPIRMSRAAWLWLKGEQLKHLERGIQMSLADVLDAVLAPLMAEGVGAKAGDLQANPNRQDPLDSVINQTPNANPNVVATIDAAATETQALRDEIRRLEKRVEDEIARLGEARERDQRPAPARKKPARKSVNRGPEV